MRKSETYRSERRSTWRAGTPNGVMPWENFNTQAPRYHLGTLKPAGHIPAVSRSKYMPHESTKRGGTGPVFA